MPTENILFNEFEKLDYRCWHDNKKHDIKVEIELSDNENSVEPSKKQIETLNFIKQNQKLIIQNIWKYYNDLMIPIYDEAVGLENDRIAKNITEISKIFGIKKIEIPQYNQYESNYFSIVFDFDYDCEHGLYILFKNNVPIDFFDFGTKSDDAVILYENGLQNKDKSKIKIKVNRLNGERVFEGNYYDNEEINVQLKKGAYRAYYIINSSSRIRNIIIDSDKEIFNLNHILKNCI
ncbi:DUF6985 domain-containing protein [Cellulophaga sp. RHA19]|uniref:DUF6985 domain-containing protein n=1 Tax=Cellulophaga sp. RHA19 TaxID=1798237 RepID=UPI0012FDE591|nr:hypothetical protein [Cellulophaga sp. RHA19]